MTGRIKTTRQARKARFKAYPLSVPGKRFQAITDELARLLNSGMSAAFYAQRAADLEAIRKMGESLAAAHTTDLREQSKLYAVSPRPDSEGE